jgi:membrane protein
MSDDTEPFAPLVVRALWRVDPAALPTWKASPIRIGRVAYAVVRDVVAGRLALHAASLVYTTILSIVPIFALGFSVLKGFGVHYRFEPLVMNALAPLGTQASVIADRLMAFVDKMDVGVLGAVGLAVLFYTAISVVQKVEAACNEIWHVRQERPLTRKFTDYLSILLIGPVLIFSALGLAASALASEPIRQLSEFRPLGLVIDMVTRLAPILLLLAMFTFLYKFIPNTRVPLRSAVVGAVVATVIWVIAGIAFGRFVQGATSYTAIYSALAALILFFIWLDVSWMIMLVGATVSFYDAHPEYLLLGVGEARLSSRARERLALAVGHELGKALYAGEAPLTAATLARRIRVPDYAVRDTLDALAAAGLVSRTAAQPARWLPTRPLEATDVKVLLDAAREHGHCVPDPAIPSPAKELERQIDRAFQEALSGWTLKDLALGPEEQRQRPSAAVAEQRSPNKAGRL